MPGGGEPAAAGRAGAHLVREPIARMDAEGHPKAPLAVRPRRQAEAEPYGGGEVAGALDGPAGDT